MARLARLSLPGHVHYLAHRGNNGQPVFQDDADYHTLLAVLAQAAREHAVALHAYVLLPNQWHLLATPVQAEGAAAFMQAVGRHYVRYFNDRHQRTGTLWEGRYRSALVQPDAVLLACMVCLDLQPVRAGLSPDSAQYPWSSYHHYTGARPQRLLVAPPVVWQLGNTPFSREAAYARLVQAGVSAAAWAGLSDAGQHGWAIGDAAFVAQVQEQSGRRAVKAKAGRPPKIDAQGRGKRTRNVAVGA